MMKFHGAHRRIKEIIDAGQLGKITYMRAQLSCWYPPIRGAWRQDPRLGGRVGYEPLDQLGLDGHTHSARGRRDRVAQRLSAQRAHLDPRQLAAALGPQDALHEHAKEIGA